MSVHFYIPEYLLAGSEPKNHYFVRAPQYVYQSFQRKFASQTEFERVKLTSTPPEKGLFCSIRVTEKHQPTLRSLGELVTILTLFLIPSYDDTLGYHVKYEVYVDTVLKKHYEYDINGKMLLWAVAPLAVPFMSGKWEIVMDPHSGGKGGWYDGLEEALWSTVGMFFLDAHRDGLL